MPIDVLMLQVGTPDAPTTPALRRYLREFLGDPRVIEAPAIARWLLVNLIIVPFRSPKSAAKYRLVWDATTGSPLMSITVRQRDLLQESLGSNFRVRFGMRYGNPSIGSVVDEMMREGCRQLVVLPMYPQYSATTTAAGLDALFDALKRQRTIPAMRVISDYHLDDGYIQAVADRVQRFRDEAVQSGRTPDMHLISFHGIPKSYIDKGDPYQQQCIRTAHAVADRLGWQSDDWKLVFQSRLGRQEWLTPYTDETLKELGSQGVRRVLVTQPGFTADCLETIDEIGREGQEEFESTGGEDLIRVPCLNDDAKFIAALRGLVEREIAGWA